MTSAHTQSNDIFIQDQTSKPIFAKFNEVSNSTVLSANAVRDSRTITVADTTGFVDGKYIILFHPETVNFSFYTQVGTPAGNIITLDTPLEFAYPTGTFVDAAITNMVVDGSGAPRIFGLRGTGVPPGVKLKVDITRIIFSCIATTPLDLSLFANLEKLTRGLVLRKRDGIFRNMFNVKDNSEIKGVMFDFQILEKSKPNQGVDGFSGRLTFGGQNKVGVTVRLDVGEDFETIIQDDLTAAHPASSGTITLLEIMAEGHIVV